MKKLIATLAALAAVITLTAACGGSSDSGTDVVITPTTIPAPTTTTTDNRAEKLALCLEAYSHISEGMDAMSTGAALLPYADRATVLEFLNTAREFVSVSKETVRLCSEFDPAGSAAALAGLNELDASLRSLELYL